jgi:hypothetical protein
VPGQRGIDGIGAGAGGCQSAASSFGAIGHSASTGRSPRAAATKASWLGSGTLSAPANSRANSGDGRRSSPSIFFSIGTEQCVAAASSR